jgi:hypothetical protein
LRVMAEEEVLHLRVMAEEVFHSMGIVVEVAEEHCW